MKFIIFLPFSLLKYTFLFSALLGIVVTLPPYQRSPSPDWDALLRVPVEESLFDDLPFHQFNQPDIVEHSGLYKTSSANPDQSIIHEQQGSPRLPGKEIKDQGQSSTAPKQSKSAKRRQRTRTEMDLANQRKRENRKRLKEEEPEKFRTLNDKQNELRREKRKNMTPEQENEFLVNIDNLRKAAIKRRKELLKQPENEAKLKIDQERTRSKLKKKYRRRKEKINSGTASKELIQSIERRRNYLRENKRMERSRKKELKRTQNRNQQR